MLGGFLKACSIQNVCDFQTLYVAFKNHVVTKMVASSHLFNYIPQRIDFVNREQTCNLPSIL